VSKSPHLNPLIQKNSKTLSFRPLLQTAARAFSGVSDETYHLFGTDLAERVTLAMRAALAPGPHLDEQNLRMGINAVQHIDELGDGKRIKLYEWVAHTIVQATSEGVYGANHPFKDPEVEKAFW
jgi:hypothetical protein